MEHKYVACHKNLLYLQVIGGGDVSQIRNFYLSALSTLFVNEHTKRVM